MALGQAMVKEVQRLNRRQHGKSHLGRLAEVERKIAALTALRGELRRMVQSCRRGRISECRVIEVLADHSHAHCASPAHAASARAVRFGD